MGMDGNRKHRIIQALKVGLTVYGVRGTNIAGGVDGVSKEVDLFNTVAVVVNA